MKLYPRHERILKAVGESRKTTVEIFDSIMPPLKLKNIEKYIFELYENGLIFEEDGKYYSKEKSVNGESDKVFTVEKYQNFEVITINFETSQNIKLLKNCFEFFGYIVLKFSIKQLVIQAPEALHILQIYEDIDAILYAHGSRFIASTPERKVEQICQKEAKHLSVLDPKKDIQIGVKFEYRAQELTICVVSQKRRVLNDNIFIAPGARVEFQAIGEGGEIISFTVDTTRKNSSINFLVLKNSVEPKRLNWALVKNKIQQQESL